MDKVQEDAKLQEFLAVKRPRSLAKVWANDDDQGVAQTVVPPVFVTISISRTRLIHLVLYYLPGRIRPLGLEERRRLLQRQI